MKAIRVHEFGPPEVMKLEEFAEPAAGPGQVVVEIKAIGLNPVETYVRAGIYPNKPALPYTPGTDAAGEIESVGDEVDRFKPGDRVYTAGTISGAYAQMALCNVDQVHLLPKKISFEQGAALNVPYGTAYRGVFDKGKARAGQYILVHGATGGVGIAAVQFAVALGMIVIGTGGTEAGRKLVTELGAAHVLDHKSPNYLDEVKKFTGGRGVDLIIELAADKNLGKDLTVLRKNGRIVVIGSRGKVEINPRDIMSSEAHIVGLSGGAGELASEAHAAIGAGLRSGTLRPIISKEFPLSDAAKAHHEIIEKSAAGKVVLIP